MNIVTQLKRDEGVRLKPYKDSVGKFTIGIGRNLDDVGLTLQEAELLLANDISKAKGDLLAAFPWAGKLDDARFGVLVNMTFNLGIAGLLGFKDTLANIENGYYDLAADAMLESKWAEQVGSRAHRLAQQMRSGAWVQAVTLDVEAILFKPAPGMRNGGGVCSLADSLRLRSLGVEWDGSYLFADEQFRKQLKEKQ